MIYALSGDYQLTHCFKLLSAVCNKVFISCKQDQQLGRASILPRLFDLPMQSGPAAGLLSAYRYNPEMSWLVLACDYPWADSEAINDLKVNHSPRYAATVYKNSVSDVLEPLFAIGKPGALDAFRKAVDRIGRAANPQRVLQSLKLMKLTPKNPKWLCNMNKALDLELSS